MQGNACFKFEQRFCLEFDFHWKNKYCFMKVKRTRVQILHVRKNSAR